MVMSRYLHNQTDSVNLTQMKIIFHRHWISFVRLFQNRFLAKHLTLNGEWWMVGGFFFVSTIKAKSALPDNLSDLISLKNLIIIFTSSSHISVCWANSLNQNINNIIFRPLVNWKSNPFKKIVFITCTLMIKKYRKINCKVKNFFYLLVFH